MVWETKVFGVDVKRETQCKHYSSDSDIIAIKFPCCEKYYSCYQCHEAVADHAAQAWSRSQFAVEAVLCGRCGEKLTIEEYLNCKFRCPHCKSNFNPGCRLHYGLYFEI